MKILGIETSCDETAVSLIEAEGDFGTSFRFKVLGNALYSQVAIHAPYGGVFPNLAKREHAKNLVPLLENTLKEAGQLDMSENDSLIYQTELETILTREPELLEQVAAFLRKHGKPAIDAIAVTRGPGLEPCLWVGVNFARALSLAWDVPVVGVNHMEGHIVMSMMKDDQLAIFDFPILSLLISGGHTELVLSRSFMEYELLGATRDDAAGEAFDKVARMLELPYPGGPEISRLAAEARSRGLTSERSEVKPREFSFTPPMLHSKDYDFSFSGLKTEVRKLVETSPEPGLGDTFTMEVALAFENAVAEVLVAKTVRAADQYGARAVLVGGGVSANTFIRLRLGEALAKTATQLLVPPPDLATDNALMIALAGYFHASKSEFTDSAALRAEGNLKLTA